VTWFAVFAHTCETIIKVIFFRFSHTKKIFFTFFSQKNIERAFLKEISVLLFIKEMEGVFKRKVGQEVITVEDEEASGCKKVKISVLVNNEHERVAENRITAIKAALKHDYGIEAQQIPSYFAAMRAHDLGLLHLIYSNVGPVKLYDLPIPQGTVSLEDFDHKTKHITVEQKKLQTKIHGEKANVVHLEKKIAKPTCSETEKQKLNIGIQLSIRIINDCLAQLYRFDKETYALCQKRVLDVPKFYAEIAPMLIELNDLVKAKASWARFRVGRNPKDPITTTHTNVQGLFYFNTHQSDAVLTQTKEGLSP